MARHDPMALFDSLDGLAAWRFPLLLVVAIDHERNADNDAGNASARGDVTNAAGCGRRSAGARRSACGLRG